MGDLWLSDLTPGAGGGWGWAGTNESVVSLGLHTGATLDSEVPRQRGDKYQHEEEVR